MVKIKYVLIALLGVSLGISATIYLFQSEEKKIRKQFHLLSKWASKAPDETPLTWAQKIKSMDHLFTSSCVLKAPAYSISGSYSRNEIAGVVTQGRFQLSQLSLRFYDLVITFPERGIAKVTLTARLTGKSHFGENVDETHELECVLKKIENHWLFSNVEVVEVLKK